MLLLRFEARLTRAVDGPTDGRLKVDEHTHVCHRCKREFACTRFHFGDPTWPMAPQYCYKCDLGQRGFKIDTSLSEDAYPEWARLKEHGRIGYQTLLEEDSFCIGGRGMACSQSVGEEALLMLLLDDNGLAAAASLIDCATPCGQLYALFGLSMKDSAAFEQNLRRHPELTDPGVMVDEYEGCCGGEVNSSTIISRIRKGYYRMMGMIPPTPCSVDELKSYLGFLGHLYSEDRLRDFLNQINWDASEISVVQSWLAERQSK